MWPTEARTTKSSPRYLLMVLALAGLSTITSCLPTAADLPGAARTLWTVEPLVDLLGLAVAVALFLATGFFLAVVVVFFLLAGFFLAVVVDFSVVGFLPTALGLAVDFLATALGLAVFFFAAALLVFFAVFLLPVLAMRMELSGAASPGSAEHARLAFRNGDPR